MEWLNAHWAQISTILSALLFLVAKIPGIEHNTIAEVAIWAIKQFLPTYTGPGSETSSEPAKDQARLDNPKQ